MNTTFFCLSIILILISPIQSAIYRRAIQDYHQPTHHQYYYQQQQQHPHVVHNVVTDRLVGGPTSLGWAQVPHVLSPMFSPVFGG
ncbi:unnamed protein product [Caenorhabditis angaria]|uniref:Secreted protein n=1 Tax=Caenorhabditis angaria TaxID=860376 RepID=A0A9P1IBJ4_9PELO|nr:unnamed protein product [Caenorhabditis angaria]